MRAAAWEDERKLKVIKRGEEARGLSYKGSENDE